MNEIIVYTCITNGKDTLKEYEPEKGVRYICFNDGTVEFKTNQWEDKKIDKSLNFKDPRLTARYYKINPSKVLPTHTWSMWIDGSLIPRVRIKDLFNYIKDKPTGVYSVKKHPGWDCIYSEAEAIKYYKYDDPEKIDSIVKRYKKEGYPSHFGLHETGVLFRKNIKNVKEFDKLWWNEVSKNSKRDQMSFDYIRWKTGIEIFKLNPGWFCPDPNQKFFGHRHGE